MDEPALLTLIRETYVTDAISQQITKEIQREVFCKKVSVSASEWYNAGLKGLKAEYRVTVFAPDYNGEELAELDGKRYSIYRTYQGKPDEIELYLARKAGVIRECQN